MMCTKRQLAPLWLLALFCLLAMPFACHQDLDLQGFPCEYDSDCLQLTCQEGRCGAPGETTADASPVDSSPDSVIAEQGEQPPERPTLPPYQPCYGGVQERADVGACRSGVLHPTTRLCEGQIRYTAKELCDGVDNNCDGKVDNDPLCCPSKGEEKCDGIDNDCDGLIDEEFAGKGESCKPKSTRCKEYGLQICYRGKVVCQSPLYPEKCANSIDDNCDGVADQEGLCGARHSYMSIYVRNGGEPGIQLTINGKKAQRGFGSVERVPGSSSYEYTLIKAITSRPCEKNVLFVTPRNSEKLFVSYFCNGKDYQVSIRNSLLKPLPNIGLYVVQPEGSKEQGDFWARVDVSSCAGIGASCRLDVSQDTGGKVSRVNVGHFRLDSNVCVQSTQPAFVTLYQKDADGFATIRSLGGGSCDVFTFDTDGKPADRNFAMWIPNPKQTIWATFAVDGTMVAHNGHHKILPWSLAVSNQGGQVRYQVKHPSMSGATAVLLNTYSPAILSGDIRTNEAPLRLYLQAFDPFVKGEGVGKLASFTVMLAH